VNKLRTVMILATLAAGVVVVGGIVRATSSDDTPPPQPRTTPSVGPSGQQPPFNWVIPPTVASPGLPTMHGNFRLVPYGYAGSLPRIQDIPANLRNQTGELLPTSDPLVVKASWLYKEPSDLPPGYTLSGVAGVGRGNADFGVTLYYEGSSFPLVVSRQAIVQRPIDVFLYPQTGNEISTIEAASIGINEAIFEKAAPGSKYQSALTIQFVTGNILTSIEWRVSDPTRADDSFQQLLKTAESLLR
jgi:hypothetical protein